MSSLVSDMAALVFASVRTLQGESVTLRTSAGDIAAEISDAVVSLDPAAVGVPGEGPGSQSGVLRLAETHRAAALTSYTATVRGSILNVVHVAEPVGGMFRVEISSDVQDRSNLFDLSGNQAVWHGA